MATRSYSLQVLADISKYQAEFAKIPGYTDKQAAKAAERLQRQMSKAQAQAAKSAERAASKSAMAWGKAFAKISVAKEAASAIADVTTQVADLRNELVDTATKSGVLPETLAGLRLAAEGSGQELSALDSVLNTLPKRLADTARGTGESLVAFERLGIAATNADGSLRSTDEVLKESIGKLQAIADPTERAAAAIELFGEGGGALNVALGDTPLEAFTDQAERFGVGVGPQAAASAAKFQREIANLKMNLQGALATFTDLFGGGGELLADFNAGFVFISAFFTQRIKDMMGAVKGFGDVVKLVLAGEFVKAGKTYASSMLTLTQGTINGISVATEAMEAYQANNKAIQRGAEVTADATPVVRENTTATREAVRAEKSLEQAIVRRAAVQVSLQGITSAAGEDQLNAGEKLVRGYERQSQAIDQQVERLQKLETTGVDVSAQLVQATEARIAIEARYARDVTSLQTQTLKSIESGIASATAHIESALSELKAYVQNFWGGIHQGASLALQGVDDLWSQSADRRAARASDLRAELEAGEESLTAAETAELEKRLSQANTATRRAFRVHQAAGIADVTISGIVAAAAALQPPPVGLGPVAGGVLAAGVGISTAAAVAQIAGQEPPSYHSGGAGDEFNARLRLNEGVLTPQGVANAGGPEGVRDLNSGRGAGRSATRIQLVYGHRMYQELTLDELAMAGPLHDAVNPTPGGQMRRRR